MPSSVCSQRQVSDNLEFVFTTVVLHSETVRITKLYKIHFSLEDHPSDYIQRGAQMSLPKVKAISWWCRYVLYNQKKYGYRPSRGTEVCNSNHTNVCSYKWKADKAQVMLIIYCQCELLTCTTFAYVSVSNSAFTQLMQLVFFFQILNNFITRFAFLYDIIWCYINKCN